MPRTWFATLAVLAVAALVGACSGDEDAAKEPGDAPSSVPEAPASVSEAPVSDGDQPTAPTTTTTSVAFSLDFLNPAMEAGGVMVLLGGVACGLKADGGIECWGTPRHGFEWHPPDGSFIALSGGCGLRPDQTIECWNGFDPPAGRFTAVSDAGSWHACGVRADQTIECWGDDEVESGPPDKCAVQDRPCHNLGQDGYGQASPPGGTFTAVATGWWHSCGLRTDQTIACWGRNDFPGNAFPGQARPPDGTFTAIAAGYLHSCGVRTDQTIACWGSNRHYQFTSGQVDPPEGTFTAVSAGAFHSCGIRTDQTIACWGEYAASDGRTVYHPDPPGGRFVAVIAGDDHSCGLRTTETIVCWGTDDSLARTVDVED